MRCAAAEASDPSVTSRRTRDSSSSEAPATGLSSTARLPLSSCDCMQVSLPTAPPFSAQRTAVVLLRSCQSKLATLTVRSGEELYGGCAPFVALLFRKERIRGKVCSVLWRRRKEKEQKHLSTPPGTRRRRKLSKEKKTKKKNKPASQGRTTCKWGKVFYEVQLSFLQVQQETDCTWT